MLTLKDFTEREIAILEAMLSLGAHEKKVNTLLVAERCSMVPTRVGYLLRKMPSCVTRFPSNTGGKGLWMLKSEIARLLCGKSATDTRHS